METTRTTISTSIDLALTPIVAFEVLVEELSLALMQEGLHFETGINGSVSEGAFQVGHVVSWKPGESILLQWQQANWNVEERTYVEIRFEQINGGTRVTLEHQEWGELIGGAEEQIGWFARKVAAPFLKATAPTELGEWLTDRQARRPTGAQARKVYRDPLYHYPNFRALLAELGLAPNDYLLEIGCGGGALLKEALTSGCRAAAIDHSPEMVRLAQEVNQDAIAEGRLEVHLADAAHLPFSETTFSCAMMTGVFGFLPDPIAALQEIRRVLFSGGRLVMLGSDPGLRGTLAAPEPMASRLRFYEDDELKRLAEAAGFQQVQVTRRDLVPFALQVGIPEKHLALFAGRGAPFLLAQKD